MNWTSGSESPKISLLCAGGRSRTDFWSKVRRTVVVTKRVRTVRNAERSSTAEAPMLSTLDENFRVIRLVLPHAGWLSKLTGVSEYSIRGIDKGRRRVSVRHTLQIASAFGLDHRALEYPILGELVPSETSNVDRRLWLQRAIRVAGGPSMVCRNHPCIGRTVLGQLLRRSSIVSPIMCELLGQHLGWVVDPDLLRSPVAAECGTGLSAEKLLEVIRLDRHKGALKHQLPWKTDGKRVAVAAEIRYAAHDYESFYSLLAKKRIDVLSIPQRDWFVEAAKLAEKEGRMTNFQLQAILAELRKRRQVAKKWPKHSL